jgi:hypothetical protein
VNVAQVDAHFDLSRDIANLVQDRCTVCTERTIGSEIIFDEAGGSPRGRESRGISFQSIWRHC